MMKNIKMIKTLKLLFQPKH